MNILFAASEGLPYAKSGGLADVVGSLPAKLKTRAVTVSVIMPLYQTIIETMMPELEYVKTINVKHGMFDTDSRIFAHTISGVTTYFVENREYFERDNLYGYVDDGGRFAYFQLAVMNFILEHDTVFDVIHCHDWHTGMIPVLGKTLFKWHERIAHLKYVYTIHNLAFQGNFPSSVLTDCFDLTMDLVYDNSVNFDDGISYMKGGIFYADKITTVSQSYAREILTPEFGERMDGVLRLREPDLVGIVNGIDTKLWNPAKDTLLTSVYDVDSLDLKAPNKSSLQANYGLTVDADIPLFGMVTRLTDQKGVTLLIDTMEDIVQMGIQVIVLGSGNPHYEDRLAYLAYQYPKNVCFYKGYNENLAHEIYAGSDFFLMPSAFEPCGISQLISMRYGTLPIVHETGGLRDTVIPYNVYTGEGTGVSFTYFNNDEFYSAVERAVGVFGDKRFMKTLQTNAMRTDVDWLESARAYRDLYRNL